MADEYQKSSNLVGSLAPTGNVLARGVVDMQMEPQMDGSHRGSVLIDINQIRGSVANPLYEVYEYLDGGPPGYQKYLTKTPFTRVYPAGAGTVTVYDSVYTNLYWDMDKTGSSLVIEAYDGISKSAAPYYSPIKHLYYVILGTSITGGDVFTP